MSSKIQKRIAPAKELDSTNSNKESKGFQPENKPTKDNYPTRALITLTSLILLISYVETMVLPGIPTIQKDFLASAPVAAWITSSVLLVGAISSPLFGKFGDIYGKKKLILIALTFYTAGVGIAGFSTSIYFLIFARAIQGVGLAMFPLALAMVTDIFPKEKLAAAQGLIAGGAGISTSAGLVLGSYVIQTLGWRYAFHTAFILSVVLFVLAIVVLRPDVRFVKSKVDYFGAMLLMAGLALILIYLTEGSTLGWLSIEELAFLIPGIALTFGFFAFESKVGSPLIQLSLLKVRNVLIANLVVIVAGLANFLVFFAVVYFAEQPVPYGLGLDILSTGLMLAPATVAMLIVGPIAGRMVTKIGPKPVLLTGSLVSMVSYVLFIVNRATEAAVIVDAIVAFAGIIALLVPVVNMISVSLPKDSITVGQGLNATLKLVGSAVGPVLTTTILATYSVPLIKTISGKATVVANLGSATAFNIIFEVGIVLSAITMVLSLAISNYAFNKKSPRSETTS